MPGLPARPLLSLHFGPVSALLSQPFRPRSPPPPHPTPGRRSGSPPLLQPSRARTRSRRGGRSAAAPKAPPTEVALDSVEAQEPALLPPAAFPTCPNLPAAPDSHPSTILVAEVCNLQAQPAREKRREVPDSPPRSTRRCRVPRGPGLRAVQTTVTNPRAGGPSGNGAAEQEGSRLRAQRSVAVPDSGRARCTLAATTAAGCAADPPGSAELGSSTNPRAPTSSRPRAPERAGRRRAREQRGGGKVVGEELGARGEKEGSRREKEEGDGEDLPLLALHPPAPRSSGEREGAPCIPISP